MGSKLTAATPGRQIGRRRRFGRRSRNYVRLRTGQARRDYARCSICRYARRRGQRRKASEAPGLLGRYFGQGAMAGRQCPHGAAPSKRSTLRNLTCRSSRRLPPPRRAVGERGGVGARPRCAWAALKARPDASYTSALRPIKWSGPPRTTSSAPPGRSTRLHACMCKVAAVSHTCPHPLTHGAAASDAQSCSLRHIGRQLLAHRVAASVVQGCSLGCTGSQPRLYRVAGQGCRTGLQDARELCPVDGREAAQDGVERA